MEFTGKTPTLLVLILALSGCAKTSQYDASTHVWCTFQDTVPDTNHDISDEVFPGSRFQDQDPTDHCIYQNSSSYEEQRKQLQESVK